MGQPDVLISHGLILMTVCLLDFKSRVSPAGRPVGGSDQKDRLARPPPNPREAGVWEGGGFRAEWINEIPTVPIYYLAKPQPRERAWQNQRGKKTLLSLTLV